MEQPIIGVVTFRGESANGLQLIQITEAYVQALLRAGALPMLIPLGLTKDQLDEILLHLSAVLFPGGGDVHPDRYQSEMHPKVSEVDEDRDRIEIYLVNRVIEKKLPFLGICRGLQVINVALGGTLYEDIADQHPHSLKHDLYDGYPRDHLGHQVEIKANSCLAKLLRRNQTAVNSLHHQGIRMLAPGLQASAIAPDGIVEAVEIPGHPFGLAVQWHPEWLQEDAAMQALFRAFVEAAGSFPANHA